MFFKSLVQSLAILALASQIMGCSKEEAPYHDVIRIQLKGASCLAESINKIEAYFDGYADQADVNAIWTCYSFALRTFDEYVEGQAADSYTADELRDFLETYFLNEQVKKTRKQHLISNALLDEMMLIKRLFLGGSTSTLRKDELLKTLDLIKVFKQITTNLLPHSQILFITNPDAEPSEEQFVAAEIALDKALSDLIGLLNPDTSRYEVSNLTRLLNELHLFFLDLDPNSKFGKAHIYVPAVSKIKSLLLNTNSNAFEPGDWPAVGRLLGQLAGMGLRAYYSFDIDSLHKTDKLNQIQATALSGLQVLDSAINIREQKTIAVSEFDEILDELDKIKVLPLSIPAEEFKKLTGLLLNSILNPQGLNPDSGLSASKVNYFRQELLGWAQVQRLTLQKSEDLENPYWRQFKLLMATPFSLSLDNRNRLILDGDQSPTNLEGATRLNWASIGIGMLFRTYISEPKRLNKPNMELTTEELHTAFLDLHSVFVALELIDKADFSYDESLFRDANLFMSRSDGDDLLSFFEVTEYLHFVFAGIDAGNILIDEADTRCKQTGVYNALDVTCFRHDFQTKSPDYLKHLPFYSAYAAGLSNSQWQKDIQNMERTNRLGGSSPDPILNSDIYETFVMLQYIEIIMLRFDVDRSGDLDIKEALKAFKHFKNVIGGLLGLDVQTESDEIEAIFTYMLEYGEAPNVDDPLARMRFQNWKWKKKKWRLAAHRGTLLQILATLKGL